MPFRSNYFEGVLLKVSPEKTKLKILREIRLFPRMKIRKPRKDEGEHHPRCGVKECKALLRRITFDTGYRPKKFVEHRNPPERTKRGRKKKPENKRIQPIGWWCPTCRIFYYEDGDILPDITMTVIVRVT